MDAPGAAFWASSATFEIAVSTSVRAIEPSSARPRRLRSSTTTLASSRATSASITSPGGLWAAPGRWTTFVTESHPVRQSSVGSTRSAGTRRRRWITERLSLAARPEVLSFRRVGHLELVLLFLLLAVVALTGLARRFRVPYPIFLVLGGSLLGFAPGVPDVELDPDVVLLLFLPPLLFNLAYLASLRDLRRDMRTISLQSVGLVLITASVVAVVMHAAIPSLPWAAAFAFGAIVSPTDPLAAVEIARRLGVPRRMINVIEGESLVNDGTALVVYRTAVAAATGATFDLLGASGDFVLNVAGGVVVGVDVAFVLVLAFRRLHDDVLGVTLSLAAGYCAYIPAEQIGVSGVIAAVAVGLVLGQRTHVISTP